MYIIPEDASFISKPENIKVRKDNLTCEVCLQSADVVNNNRRRYSRYVLGEGIQPLRDQVRRNQLLGELDHPIDTNPVRQLTVLYKESSHLFMEFGWDGNLLKGVIKTVRTPNGNTLKNLIEDGVMVGWSMRGAGDLKESYDSEFGKINEVTKLRAVTWDSVSKPSHNEATLIKINESVQRTLTESVGFAESEGFIFTDNGMMYLPNDFDMMVENRILRLKDKFEIGKNEHIQNLMR